MNEKDYLILRGFGVLEMYLNRILIEGIEPLPANLIVSHYCKGYKSPPKSPKNISLEMDNKCSISSKGSDKNNFMKSTFLF